MKNATEIAFKIVDEDVSHERLDGEVIAVNLRTGHYYSMSGPAADVWSLMCAGVPRTMWAEIVGNAFSTSIEENDLDEFISACTNAELISHTSPVHEDGFNLPSDYIRTTWVAPRLEEFDDMRDLILVDPIHDITQLGWPHTK